MIFLLLILIQVVVFGSLIWFLQNLLRRHYGAASSHIEMLAQDSERRLLESKKKTDEANAYYEEIVSKAKTDAERLKQELAEEALKEKQELIERARQEGVEIMDRAKSARKLLEENWAEEIFKKARSVTLAVLQSVLPQKISSKIQSEWVNEMLASGLDGLARLNVEEGLKEVGVASPVPLEESQKKTILAKLREKTGRSYELVETLDPALILGFRLTIGAVVIDGSLTWKIKEALKHAGHKENA
ncbi:MAG: F0F1 ATP synthase subunit delta [Candidatus Omnitrophota bacterium]|jgi:F0F1-type ATP synthase delta subunit